MQVTVRMARLAPGCYRASCPALPGCVVYGNSERQAGQEIALAIRGYVANLGQTLSRELAVRFNAHS